MKGEQESPSINPLPQQAQQAEAERLLWGWAGLGIAFLRAIPVCELRQGGSSPLPAACNKKTSASSFQMAATEGGSGMDHLVCVTCQQPAKLQCPRW